MRWDGASWTLVGTPATWPISSISGTASDDVWLVANNQALHWDGVSFTQTSGLQPMTTAVWALSRGDAIAANPSGCQRWNGGTWTSTNCSISGDIARIWASAADDIWVVAAGQYHGDVWTSRAHWDGRVWATESWYVCDYCQPGDYPGQLQSVFGTSRTDVWINGSWHYDGARWTRVCLEDQYALAGAGTGRLFGMAYGGADLWQPATLTLYDGSVWSALASTQPTSRIIQIRGSSAQDVWAVGASGGVVAFDGANWTTLLRYWPDLSFYAWLPSAIFGTGSSDIWGMAGQPWHFDGSAWTQVAFEEGGYPQAGWSRTDRNAIVFGELPGSVLASWHWDGAQWTRNTVDFGGDRLQALWGSAPDEVWAAGFHVGPPQTNAAWHWDGTAWSRLPEGDGIGYLDIFGTGSTDVWAIELRSYPAGRRVLHWDGVAFIPSAQLEVDLIAGTGPDDVWAAGYNGLWHYDGAQWTAVARSWSGPLRSLWAIPGSASFAVSRSGAVFSRSR
jgi:hypothetical protein